LCLRLSTVARRVVDAAWLGAVLATSGCRSCRDEHPYVPYAIEPSSPGPEAFADAAASVKTPVSRPDAGPDPFAGRPAVEAEPGSQSFAIDGVTLPAPPGLVIRQVLMGDADAGAEKTAFAIAGRAQGDDPSEVVFYRGRGADGTLSIATIVPAPAQLAADAGCVPETRLVGVGKRSVLAELGVVCSPLPPGAPPRPTRYVAVIDAAATAKVRFALMLTDPQGAAALSVDAVVADRDGDGRDDLALRFTLEGGDAPLEPGPQVSLVSAWLDRSAGLSRDAEATEASFRSLAEWAATHAARAKDAPEVPRYVAQARALWRATCAESGSPRVAVVAGSGPIKCGVPRALEDLGLAEVRALASLHDPLRAALALARAERPPASRTPSRAADALKWISQQAPVAAARLMRAAAAVPVPDLGREPSWGPLAFEPSGKLLVRTRAGVVRLDPDLGDEAAAGVADWKPSVTSPDGAMLWTAVDDPCDGLPLRATFGVAGDHHDVPLPVQAPLGSRCDGGRASLVPAWPVAWGSSGLEAIVDGDLVLISPDMTRASLIGGFLNQQPPALGAPRSPDGKAYVVASEVGFLVQGEGGARLLRAAELDGTYAEQHHCVVSSDTTHVACVRAGAAWVGTWDAPGASR